MHHYSIEVGEVNYASLMDDRAAHALLESVARRLGATPLAEVQGLLCVTGMLRLEALTPTGAILVEYTPCRDKGLFTLDIVSSEEPVEKRSVEQVVENYLAYRDSGGQKVVRSHFVS